MIRSIFKHILIGIIAGAAIFFAGFFLLRILLFFFIIGAIIRLFTRNRRRFYHSYKPYRGPAFGNRYYANDDAVISIRSNRSNNQIISID